MASAAYLPPNLDTRSPSRIQERWTPMPSGANPAVYTPQRVPTVDTTVQLMITLVNISILAVLMTKRVQAIKHWTRLQPLNYLVMFIYADSILFVFLSAVISLGIGANIGLGVCLFADFLCLSAYLSTKGIYYFLVEKVFLIRAVRKPRLKDPLYIFHAFGLVVIYAILTVLQFVFRIGYIDENGQCYNGIQADVLIPLLIFDTSCNVYMMAMFVIPLRKLISYKNPNSLTRQIAQRTIIGTCITLTASLINLMQLTITQGERSWLCLIFCNLDILITVLTMNWITAKDSTDSGSTGDTNKAKNSDDTSRNERSMLRPEKPVMMPMKKKRASTDFSDLGSIEDLEARQGGIELVGPLGSHDPGRSGDGSADPLLRSRRSSSGEVDGTGNVINLRSDPYSMVQTRAGRTGLERPPGLRPMDSASSLALTSSTESMTRFVDAKEWMGK